MNLLYWRNKNHYKNMVVYLVSIIDGYGYGYRMLVWYGDNKCSVENDFKYQWQFYLLAWFMGLIWNLQQEKKIRLVSSFECLL
jgi:hypothetical protein